MFATDTEIETYVKRQPGYDEAVSREGGVLPGWGAFLRELRASAPAERRAWASAIRRELRDDGLTFTVSPDERALSRREDLDPVPWILTSNEWSTLEPGIAQRARLLEAVARDLLGPRTLISNRLLPAELIFGDPAYLRACIGLPANLGAFLFHYAVDLARGPDGRMWVLEDRAQAPSGAGYALESRTILGRVFPEWMNKLQVRRLAGWFRSFRENTLNLYQGRRLDPRVVVLTPGPYSATYFEHAYLASYLGYTLVQGDDLVVRDGTLKLKTLEGLQPVDILLRRVDAAYCDPLELRRDSFLGVAGLLSAMRNRRVACINHPGCGVLENRGLLPFLPALCKELLGEDLKLPAAATWWCGQPRELQHVLANLPKLVLKPVQRSPQQPSVFGWRCSRKELEELRAAILARPEAWVGQENIGFSTVPLLVDDHLEPRRSVLRAFAAASADGWNVMPGGLGRSAADADSHKVAMGQGGILKDVWVLGNKPESHRSLWVEAGSARSNDWFTGVFTSRGAEHLFWAGRYAERMARQVRLLRGTLHTHGAPLDDPDQTREIIDRMADLLDVYCGRPQDEDKTTPPLRERLHEALRGGPGTGSVIQNLRSLLYAAYAVRDIWSQDSWRTLSAIEAVGKRCGKAETHPFALEEELDEWIEKLYAFYGLNAGGMTRESGWVMLMLGRLLEAGLGLCELIEGLLLRPAAPSLRYAVMETALTQNENLITYRRHYRTTPELRPVLDLMLATDLNPRSLVFQLGQTAELLLQLPPSAAASLDEVSRLLKQARSHLLERPWRNGDPMAVLPGLLRETRNAFEQCSVAVGSAYFSHTPLHALETF